jgi:hypothetical protein
MIAGFLKSIEFLPYFEKLVGKEAILIQRAVNQMGIFSTPLYAPSCLCCLVDFNVIFEILF